MVDLGRGRGSETIDIGVVSLRMGGGSTRTSSRMSRLLGELTGHRPTERQPSFEGVKPGHRRWDYEHEHARQDLKQPAGMGRVAWIWVSQLGVDSPYFNSKWRAREVGAWRDQAIAS
jgi:hypothetical protein